MKDDHASIHHRAIIVPNASVDAFNHPVIIVPALILEQGKEGSYTRTGNNKWTIIELIMNRKYKQERSYRN